MCSIFVYNLLWKEQNRKYSLDVLIRLGSILSQIVYRKPASTHRELPACIVQPSCKSSGIMTFCEPQYLAKLGRATSGCQ